MPTSCPTTWTWHGRHCRLRPRWGPPPWWPGGNGGYGSKPYPRPYPTAANAPLPVERTRGNPPFFWGGRYWIRTSDFYRVKIQRPITLRAAFQAVPSVIIGIFRTARQVPQSRIRPKKPCKTVRATVRTERPLSGARQDLRSCPTFDVRPNT